MLFPIRILEEGQQVEDLGFSDGVGYVVARDGIYKKVKTALFEYLVKIGDKEDVDGLAKTVPPAAKVFTKIIPKELLRQIEAFFRKAYEKYHGEAIVLLYFNPEKKEWMVRVPPQKVLGLHVKYNASEAPGEIDGFYLASSIHSHAAAGAFHSGVDDHDELEFDGLHITIGNVDKSVRSYVARWMLGRSVFEAKLEEVLGAEIDEMPDVPAAWMDQVAKEEPVRATAHFTGFAGKWIERSHFDFDAYNNDPIGMTEVPDHTNKPGEAYAERDVVDDPFALVYDFESLLEDYRK
jgi:PRTRC genetic system protein A